MRYIFKSSFLLFALMVFLVSCRAHETTAEEGVSGEMAGAVGDGDLKADIPKEASLSGVDQVPPSASSRLAMQIGNGNAIKSLSPRKSRDISAESLVGVALCHGNDFFDNTPDIKGTVWSPYWLIDGEKYSEHISTVYSSGMHYKEQADEWVLVKLKNPENISRIVLQPRSRTGTGFPLDFHILCSEDGKDWKKVVDVKDYKLVPEGSSPEFKFDSLKAGYIKIVATKLRIQREKEYYFQLREVEVYGDDGINYASVQRGAVASAGNPLTGGAFDYKSFYSNIFDAGVKWLHVSNERALSKYRQNKSPLGFAELENISYVRKNGVNVIYRFMQVPEKNDLLNNTDKAVSDFVSSIEPVVKALKGHVSVWAVANEQNFYGTRIKPEELDAYKKAYVMLVAKASDKIREIDPGIPIEIETALFDFTWTEDVLKMGLASKVDAMGVHVYKEAKGADICPELPGTFIRNGTRFFPKDQPYASYKEEIQAYQSMIRRYNPDMKLNITETCVNTGAGSYNVSNKSQAKFLARLYLYHYSTGIGPTCWWSLDPVKTGQTFWGLTTPDGRRRDSWYAMRNLSAVMDYSYLPADEIKVQINSEVNKFTSNVYRNKEGEILIPFWAAVTMRDNNTGKATDMRVSGIHNISRAEAIDILSGTVQELEFEDEKNSVLFKALIVRDYPVVIRIRTED